MKKFSLPEKKVLQYCALACQFVALANGVITQAKTITYKQCRKHQCRKVICMWYNYLYASVTQYETFCTVDHVFWCKLLRPSKHVICSGENRLKFARVGILFFSGAGLGMSLRRFSPLDWLFINTFTVAHKAYAHGCSGRWQNIVCDKSGTFEYTAHVCSTRFRLGRTSLPILLKKFHFLSLVDTMYYFVLRYILHYIAFSVPFATL